MKEPQKMFHVLELKRRERLIVTRKTHGWETEEPLCGSELVGWEGTIGHGLCVGVSLDSRDPEARCCALVCRRSFMTTSVRRGRQRPLRPMTSRQCAGPCCMQPGHLRTSRCQPIRPSGHIALFRRRLGLRVGLGSLTWYFAGKCMRVELWAQYIAVQMPMVGEGFGRCFLHCYFY